MDCWDVLRIWISFKGSIGLRILVVYIGFSWIRGSLAFDRIDWISWVSGIRILKLVLGVGFVFSDIGY